MTKKREMGLSPAALSEQQRAKSEIEASLTIAASRPRDERAAMDAILVSCQRAGLAEKSQYNYSRGGTEIVGASIVLLEAIAQRWGNLAFSFRELARFPGVGGQPGESIVEAFAWDLQSNTRRNVQFTVSHAIKSHGRTKILTDDRDIYELVANYAQRRVRTCLQAVIPRDVVDAACEECEKTLKASIVDVAAATKKLLDAFAALNVTREMIEGRIQRRMDAITPAQIIGLRKVYASLKDGMSEPGDWFDVSAAGGDAVPPKTPIDNAKDAMRKKRASSPEKSQSVVEETSVEDPGQPAVDPSDWDANHDATADDPKTEPPYDPPTDEDLSKLPEQSRGDESDAPASEEADAVVADDSVQNQVDMWLEDIKRYSTVKGLTDILAAIPKAWPEEHQKTIADAIQDKLNIIKSGTKTSKPNVV